MADPQDDWGANDAVVPTGEEYLKTLDPARASQVKALAEGRMELPKGQALRSGPGAALLADVATYDPMFDAANAPARIAARKKFTSGTQGANITSFNTAIGHLGALATAAEDLNNTSFPLWNGIANSAISAVGDPRVTKFTTARKAVIEELGRAFKGSAPTVHDSLGWEEAINSAQSPEQMRAAIQQAAELLGSRIGAMRDSYNASMGTTDQPLPMLNDHADTVLAQFNNPDYLEKGLTAPLPAGGSEGAPPPPSDGPGSGLTPVAPSGAGPAPLAADQLQISDGTSKAVDQSVTKPIREGIARLVGEGKSANEIRAYIEQSGINPTKISGLDELVAFRKQHPEYKGGYDITIGEQNVDMSRGEGLASQIASSAPAAAVVASANTGLFGALPKIVAGADAVAGRLSGDNRDIGTIYNGALGGANYKVKALGDAHPVASLLGDTAGFIAGDAALGKGAQALGGIIGRVAPSVGALGARLPGAVGRVSRDASFGALTGLGSSDNLADIPGNVAKGATLTAVGGALGRGIVNGAAAVASPIANAGVRRLTDAGITLTPGQILGAGGGIGGKMAKGIEDRLSGFPIIGDVINSTRRSGTEDFNRAAINDVLAPIGAALPDDIPAGHAAIGHAQKAVSEAIDNALKPIHAQLDNNITADIGNVGRKVASMSKDAQSQFKDIISNDIQPFWPKNGVMTGEQLQSIKRGLDKEIASRSGAGIAPADRRLGERLEEMRDAVLDFAGRSDPANARAFAKANEAYSLLSRVEGAAAKSKDGIFSANQFRQAVTKRGYGTTTKNVATGSARMQQLSTDASTILPSSVPDSGTAGRETVARALGMLTPGAALGGAAGYHEGGSGGAITGALVGGALLSRPGARAAQWALAGSRGAKLNTLGDLLRRNAGAGGALGAPLLLSSLANKGD